MSKLNELIAQLCPEGVVFSPLVSVADVLYGFPCDASLFNTDGMGMPLARIRDVLAGKTDTYTIEQVPERYILSRGDLLVGMDGNFHVANWKTDGGILCQRVCKIYSKDEAILLNGFLSHLLKPIMKRIEDNKQGGTVKHLLDKDIKAITIPVPPVPVQSEIVRILDSFTELTAELTAKLAAELTARTKQYEYYRECILYKNDHVEWVPLLDVADTYTGLTYKPTDTAPQGTIVLRSSNIKDRQLVFEDNVYVNLDSIPARAIVQENDILICVRNGSKALIGKAAIIPKHDKKMAFGAFMTILRAKKLVIPRYLFYVWQSPRVQNMIHGDSAMAINQITKKMLEQILVPVPSLAEQENIVAVLDRFDKLNNGIVEGLPAEIEVRQKQYEYYRDKLLTFKERVD